MQFPRTSGLSPRGEAVTWSHLDTYRRECTSIEGIVGYDVGARYLRGAGDPERVMVVRSERGLFSLLGVAALAGRTFRDDDPATVAVVGEAFWKERLGGDASIVGRSITLDDEAVTIVGVMAASFQFPSRRGLHSSARQRPEARSNLWTIARPPSQPRVPHRPCRRTAETGRHDRRG